MFLCFIGKFNFIISEYVPFVMWTSDMRVSQFSSPESSALATILMRPISKKIRRNDSSIVECNIDMEKQINLVKQNFWYFLRKKKAIFSKQRIGMKRKK